jgi:hypothetical protein
MTRNTICLSVLTITILILQSKDIKWPVGLKINIQLFVAYKEHISQTKANINLG